ncbi:DegV family protein [Paenibacillus radicis (ex Xue et al. 2023)]|uniref:DegV family protein n=1 Tax=Paenibacillus radicis (ex Xue et al. 2023) TaxID=2972489 RepID=A0ABT1YKC5_9BACL|nr:DegV family protein [Paenibacillus radicis (ex Xue et al. 2023)]MCR8633637.1 DegV family protein [Paenibacillus radicis (ex Xue et al. 2023)]
MSQIRIVTDSTADIPADLQEALGIEVIPLKVHFGMDTYRDQIDMSSEVFFENLTSSAVLPTTSQPSPVQFVETYKRMLKAADTSIISVHLSSGLSGTYQSAILAKSMMDDSADLTVIDSKSASYGFGSIVVAAAEAARAGRSKDEIINLIHSMRQQLKLYFLVDTLEYLQKGGRIGKAAALVGSLLNIKPILSVSDEGTVYSVDKVRGQKKAMARIIELLKQDLGDKPLNITIAHAAALDNAELFNEMMLQNFVVKSTRYTQIGPVVGTHTGPGAVAVFVNPV